MRKKWCQFLGHPVDVLNTLMRELSSKYFTPIAKYLVTRVFETLRTTIGLDFLVQSEVLGTIDRKRLTVDCCKNLINRTMWHLVS